MHLLEEPAKHHNAAASGVTSVIIPKSAVSPQKHREKSKPATEIQEYRENQR
jgi:hypothetical protein